MKSDNPSPRKSVRKAAKTSAAKDAPSERLPAKAPAPKAAGTAAAPAPARAASRLKGAETPAAAAALDGERKPPAPKPKVKSAVKKPEAPPIPSILLEGDQPTPHVAGGPGERYSLGPVPPPDHLNRVETPGELPEAYGTKRLLLTARDPHWLYARWDLTREQQNHYNSLSADRHMVIKVFVSDETNKPYLEVHVHPESNHWFIHVGRAGSKFTAELGYYRPGKKWSSISSSAATLTPPDTMSEDTTAQFATIPIEMPFPQLLEFARAAVRENVPLAEVIIQIRASGQSFPEGPVGEWTPEQEQALSSIISMDRVRRVWMGSLELTELIRRQLQQDMSSLMASQFAIPTSPVTGISSFSSLSSPFGVAARRKGFWFNVNAELILYGATEPDAQVTIGGRIIKLRPDGTFSYRFSLPDGEYELPAVAVSYDKTDGRAAELKFSRNTEYRGEVGAHPQDPALKAPLAEHVA